MNSRLLISVYSLVKKCSAAALLLSLAFADTALAERELTIEETLKLARENNRDLQAAKESIAQVQVAVEQARAQLLPTIAAQGKYTFNYPSAVLDPATFSQATDVLAQILQSTTGSPTQALALQAYRDQLARAAGSPITIVKDHQLDFSTLAAVPLIVPGAYPAYQAAIAQKRAALANLAVTEITVLFNAATGFYGAAGTDELVAARKHAIEVAVETLKNAKARLEAGVVNRVEVTRAEFAYNLVVQSYLNAQDTRALVYRSLATLLQVREPFVVRPVEVRSRDIPVAEMQKDALRLRPEFRAYDYSIVAQRKQQLSGWLRWLPSVTGFGRFAAGNYAGFSGKEYSFAAGIQADWLLYDGGMRDASRHLAASQTRQLELQLAQLHDTINDDIAQAERELRTKHEALSTAEKSVALSKETLGLVRAQHDAGTATQLDLLAAQDALFAAEAGLAQARFDLALGDLRLQRAAGTFPAEQKATR